MSWRHLVLGLLAVVAAVGFVVSPALGGPGFLTQQKASKLFLKKGAANRRFVTKDRAASFATKAELNGLLGEAEAGARFYSRGESDARFLRPEGAIRITAGPTDWTVGANIVGEQKPTATYFADAAKLTSATQVMASAMIMPDLPNSLYGRQTKLVGAEYCYAAQANAKLLTVYLDLLSQTTGPAQPPGITDVAKDTLARTDSACRTLTATSPVAIGPADFPVMTVLIEYPTNSSQSISLGRATFVLSP
jgi:hypothetical protein